MNRLLKGTLTIFSLALLAFSQAPETVNYKCMIQLTNYEGEGAYVVVSILDGDGTYQETLYVQGDDAEWYRDIEQWWKNLYGVRRPELDGIVGETVAGGQRKMTVLKIPADKIDAGYQLRFESAVEDQEYYAQDIQFPLTTENLKQKMEGAGFIRYIRMIPQAQ
ncbi:Periplasmic protein [Croceitalea dokdonensis DOKDO 023]|uniref:Periplasmic protein n=2 Tax=Croceitalea TaxID=574891 RepID=A0A0P7AWG0_9FLAO|nr:Periplasmic protein [Croceitalea dokdonensis DOKDO 023]